MAFLKSSRSARFISSTTSLADCRTARRTWSATSAPPPFTTTLNVCTPRLEPPVGLLPPSLNNGLEFASNGEFSGLRDSNLKRWAFCEYTARTGLVENDRGRKPNGEEYRSWLTKRGRSDLLSWVDNIARPKTRAINEVWRGASRKPRQASQSVSAVGRVTP